MFYLGSTHLHRSERLDWLRKDPERYLWWLDLRSMAAEAPTYVSVGRTRVETALDYGQIATTYQELGYEWRVSDKTAKKFIDLMVKSHRITVKETNSFTLITILHFEYYCPRKDCRRDADQTQGIIFYPEVEMNFDEDETGLRTPTIFPEAAPSTTIYKETSSTNDTSTNTSLEQDLKFFEKLKSCKKILEEIAKQNHLPDSETVVEELEKFMSYNQRRNLYHESYDDFLDHIYRWFFTVYGVAIARGKGKGKENGGADNQGELPEKTKEKAKRKKKPMKPVEPETDDDEKANTSELVEMFNQFRQAFPGTKRGLEVELDNLKRKYRNWRELIPLFMPALEKAKAWREGMTAAGQFVPSWPYLRTWINDRRWENEYQPIETSQQPKGTVVSPESANESPHKDEDYGGSFGGAE